MDEKIAPHLEELTRALGEVDQKKIRAEFEKLLAFRVPPEVAKESILRKYGGTQKTLRVKDLSANLKGFEITGRILELNEKTVRPKERGLDEGLDGSTESGDGGPRGRKRASKLYTGVLADESGSVMFSSWKELPPSGEVIHVRNAYTRLWQNRVRLTIGDHSSVSRMPDSSLPPLSELSKSPEKKLVDIGAADFSVNTAACVLQLSHRELMVRGRQSRVISGVLADETARLPFTSWVELPGVDIGSIVRLEEAPIRMFRGVPSVNILSGTKVRVLEQDASEMLAFTFESIRKDPPLLKMEELGSRDGLFDVGVAGTVISVKPGSGIISRCPECGRVVQKGNCRVHGKVEGVRDMRIKAVLDDGTGTISVMFSRELSEMIYGKTLEEAEALMFSDISKDAVYEDLRRILTGRYLAVRGNASRNEYGISFVAERVWVPEADLAVRVIELLHRLDSLESRLDNDGSYGSDPDSHIPDSHDSDDFDDSDSYGSGPSHTESQKPAGGMNLA